MTVAETASLSGPIRQSRRAAWTNRIAVYIFEQKTKSEGIIRFIIRVGKGK